MFQRSRWWRSDDDERMNHTLSSHLSLSLCSFSFSTLSLSLKKKMMREWKKWWREKILKVNYASACEVCPNTTWESGSFSLSLLILSLSLWYFLSMFIPGSDVNRRRSSYTCNWDQWDGRKKRKKTCLREIQRSEEEREGERGKSGSSLRHTHSKGNVMWREFEWEGERVRGRESEREREWEGERKKYMKTCSLLPLNTIDNRSATTQLSFQIQQLSLKSVSLLTRKTFPSPREKEREKESVCLKLEVLTTEQGSILEFPVLQNWVLLTFSSIFQEKSSRKPFNHLSHPICD